MRRTGEAVVYERLVEAAAEFVPEPCRSTTGTADGVPLTTNVQKTAGRLAGAILAVIFQLLRR